MEQAFLQGIGFALGIAALALAVWGFAKFCAWWFGRP